MSWALLKESLSSRMLHAVTRGNRGWHPAFRLGNERVGGILFRDLGEPPLLPSLIDNKSDFTRTLPVEMGRKELLPFHLLLLVVEHQSIESPLRFVVPWGISDDEERLLARILVGLDVKGRVPPAIGQFGSRETGVEVVPIFVVVEGKPRFDRRLLRSNSVARLPFSVPSLLRFSLSVIILLALVNRGCFRHPQTQDNYRASAI